MPQTTIDDVLRAAGLTDIQNLQDSQDWTLFRAHSRDRFRAEHLILAFKSRASLQSVAEARVSISQARGDRPLHVLVYPSAKALVANFPRLRQELNAQTVLTTREELAGAARDWLRRDLHRDRLPTPNFIEPNFTSGGYALDGLLRWLVDEANDARPIAVLVAPAGLGKTTVARQLERLLQTKTDLNRIPLLVQSDQWAALSGAHLSLLDIWEQAVRQNFDAVVPEAQFLAHLETGSLVPIFDGFDELCTRKPDNFMPERTWSELSALLEGTNGRMVVTTRDSFWETALPESLRSGATVFHLQSFNKQQVAAYIEKRFPTSADVGRRDAAKTVVQRLQSETYPLQGALPDYRSRLWSVPLVLWLICESVDTDDSALTTSFGRLLGFDPLAAVFTQMCDRERLRRKLALASDEQMQLLEMVATELPAAFNETDLDAVAAYFPALSSPGQREALHSHALLDRDGSAFKSRFDFQRDFMRARAFTNALKRSLTEKTHLPARVLEILASESSGQSAAAEHLVEELAIHGLGAQDLAVAWRLAASDSTIRHKRARSALVHLFLRLLDEERTVDRAERTKRLLSTFGNPVFDGGYFEGILAGLDISDRVVKECEFANAGFKNCSFSSDTAFARCSFIGSFEIVNCDGFGQVKRVEECPMSTSATGVFAALSGRPRASVTRDDLIASLRDIVDLFYVRGRFKTVDKDTLSKRLGRSPLMADIFHELQSQEVLESHAISGLGKDRGLAIGKHAMPEVLAFIDNGVLGANLGQIADTVLAEWKR